MIYLVKRVFSVDPPVPGQRHIVDDLKERLAERSGVIEATVGASLDDHTLQRIDVELAVQVDGLSEAASIARRAIKADLRALGVPTLHLRLIDAAGGQISSE